MLHSKPWHYLPLFINWVEENHNSCSLDLRRGIATNIAHGAGRITERRLAGGNDYAPFAISFAHQYASTVVMSADDFQDWGYPDASYVFVRDHSGNPGFRQFR